MRVVVAGATGFVGQKVVPALLADGHDVRAGSRRPEAASPRGWDWVRLDVDGPLDEAFAGMEALVYLVHQLGTDVADLVDREAATADRVREAAERAGIRRIVFLGAPVPAGPPSAHIAARLETGERLRASPRVSCVELRASMIVGAGSESWTMVRDLALRLPVMVLPRWLSSRTAPIGVDDVVRAITAAVRDPMRTSAAFDLPGPEVLTAREILLRAARADGRRPVMVPVPVLSPRLSSQWLRFVTRADYGVARQLVDGLRSDLVPRGASWFAHAGGAPGPLDDAMRRAIADDPVDGAGARWERVAARVSRRP